MLILYCDRCKKEIIPKKTGKYYITIEKVSDVDNPIGVIIDELENIFSKTKDYYNFCVCRDCAKKIIDNLVTETEEEEE